MVGKKPERKPFGRDGPPRGYPKDPSAYADPENWRYPLHTSWNAKAARRYFDEKANREKYTEEECAYIDWRIDSALKQFENAGPSGKRRAAQKPSQMRIEKLNLIELLGLFLGTARTQRAQEMDESLVVISKMEPEEIEGRVKEYVVQIDLKKRIILHDCQDWRKNMDSKNMCKHLGRLFLSLDQNRATDLLRKILQDRDQWNFIAP